MRKVRRLLKENWIPIVVGILLTKWAVDYAYRVRGYDAIGSEWLVLPFTIFIFNWGKAVWEELRGEKPEVVVEEKPAKKKAENTIQLFHRLVEDYNISEPVREKMEVWFRYKMERKESYKEQGMKSLLKKTENNEGSYGANEICNLIEDCMANNWKGIIWKILEERKQQRPATRTEQIQQRVSEVDSW